MSHNHEEAMSLHCSNCGAQLHITSRNKKFVTCDYCGSVYRVKDLLDDANQPEQTDQPEQQLTSQIAKDPSAVGRIVGMVIVGGIVLRHGIGAFGYLLDDKMLPALITLAQAVLWGVVLHDIVARKVSAKRVATCVLIAAALVIPLGLSIDDNILDGGSSYYSERDYGPVSWSSLVLGSVVPEFDGSDQGYIESNSSDSLSLEYQNVDEATFRSYASSCQSSGYTVEAEYTEDSYTAFNDAGYRLYISLYTYDDNRMDITVDAPKPMTTLIWPESTVAGDLPVPDSDQGYITTADEDYFTAYIGDMSRDQVNAYIQKCVSLGFTEEESMRDGYLWAKRSDGARLNVRYEGNRVMYVSLYNTDY